jgi:hypothetical protein
VLERRQEVRLRVPAPAPPVATQRCTPRHVATRTPSLSNRYCNARPCERGGRAHGMVMIIMRVKGASRSGTPSSVYLKTKLVGLGRLVCVFVCVCVCACVVVVHSHACAVCVCVCLRVRIYSVMMPQLPGALPSTDLYTC